MMIGRISGATRTIGEKQGYHALHLKDGTIVLNLDGRQQVVPAMQSAWLPTPEELGNLFHGGAVILTVCGTQHPPVKIDVNEADRAGAHLLSPVEALKLLLDHIDYQADAPACQPTEMIGAALPVNVLGLCRASLRAFNLMTNNDPSPA